MQRAGVQVAHPLPPPLIALLIASFQCLSPLGSDPRCVQAIDLIDEAGSRVRLQHAQLPEEARELDKELRALNKEKDAAVRGQDFEKAGSVSSSPLLLFSAD